MRRGPLEDQRLFSVTEAIAIWRDAEDSRFRPIPWYLGQGEVLEVNDTIPESLA
jgi:hypothetical protein